MKKKSKGSLTVEAVISFTLFISVMFVLLHTVKLVLFVTVFNNATAEAAKTIATGAYPISFVNEMQSNAEKKFDGIEITPETIGSAIKKATGEEDNVLVDVLTGSAGSGPTGDAIGYLNNLVSEAKNSLSNAVYKLKGSAVNHLCGLLVKSYLDETGMPVDLDNVTIMVAKLPVTDAEYKHLYSEPLKLSSVDDANAAPSSDPSATDGDFNADDVVICLEYPYEISLPLLPTYKINIRSVAIEHGWLSGTSKGPSRTEGIDISDFRELEKKLEKDPVVYISGGGYGKRYHKQDCRTLYKYDPVEMKLSEAKSKNYTPCKVCSP